MSLGKISKKEESKNIFIFSICAILGGLFISYFGLITFVKLVFVNSQDALMIPLLFNTFLWPCLSLWIFMSSSIKSLYLKVFIPSSMIILVLTFLII